MNQQQLVECAQSTMFLPSATLLLLCPVLGLSQFLDEPIYTINNLKALHSVDEKFLSISIDPAVLLAGVNLSDTSLDLAKHLSPSFIRIAGESTRFVQYVDSDEASGRASEDSVVVTPSMWFGINEWLALANLTPVFGINDFETTNGLWNPKSTMPLLEISDKFNVTCFWQLGYDCFNKTQLQYEEDLRIFRHILDAFPDKRNVWRVVAGDITKCVAVHHPEILRRTVDNLHDTVTAVMWEPSDPNQKNSLLAVPLKPRVPFWTVAHKEEHTVSFSSAISWAKQIGEAAKFGYQVIFREPRLKEIFSDTPVYWVSVLHKMFMGRNVLDMKVNTLDLEHNNPISIYAHCTKNQNSFVRSGAVTILMINNGTGNQTAYLRLGSVLKNTEVQSYILTSLSDESTDVFLNGNKLDFQKFTENKIDFVPKVRRARIMNYLSLSLPPKSIGFFVLPSAHFPACSNEESDLKQILEEIDQDQDITFPEEAIVEIAPRLGHPSPTLRDLQEKLEQELESDEKYYKRVKTKSFVLPKKVPQQIPTSNNYEVRNFFIERAKLAEKQRKQFDTEYKRPDFKLMKPKEEVKLGETKREFELELSSGEIRRILSDRARIKAAKKNIIFTSGELDEIMRKATEKILKNKNTSVKIRRRLKREARDKKDINMALLKLKTIGEERKLQMKQHFAKLKNTKTSRIKRDINLDLLKLKAEILHNKNVKKPVKTHFEDGDFKEATIRREDQISEEFLEDYRDEEVGEESPLPDEDIIAEIAQPDQFTPPEEKKKLFYNHIKPKINLFKKKLDLNIPTPASPMTVVKYRGNFQEEEPELDEIIEDIEVEDGGDFGGIHEFSQRMNTDDGPQNEEMVELWEAVELKKEKKLPKLENKLAEASELEIEKKSKSADENLSIDEEYGDLDSDDEKKPLRLKRSFWTDTQDYINQKYYSLTEGLKKWKPSDMVTLAQEKLHLDKFKRSISDNNINSNENKIEKGDYQVVFPYKDKSHERIDEIKPTKVETHIQKISQEEDAWRRILIGISEFFQDIGGKLKTFVFHDLLS